MGISALRNLGPASERTLRAAGLATAEQLERLGAAAAYRLVVERGGHPSRNLLWAMEGALLDIDWRDLPPERRQDLLRALEKA